VLAKSGAFLAQLKPLVDEAIGLALGYSVEGREPVPYRRAGHPKGEQLAHKDHLLVTHQASDTVPGADLEKQSVECLPRPVVDIEAFQAIDNFEEGSRSHAWSSLLILTTHVLLYIAHEAHKVAELPRHISDLVCALAVH
jgi:hypothetical protein